MSHATEHNDDTSPREITVRSVLLGTLLTIVLSAANVFMGLRTGITFSTSIPAAVISMGCLSALGNSGILENNMVQTQASAAGTLSNIILVLPALVIIGAWDHIPFWPSMLVCLIGGWVGVLYSIPLRRTLIVESALPFPEGVAAAEVLFAGQPDATEDAVEGGLTILGVAAACSALLEFGRTGLRLLAEQVTVAASFNHAIFRASTGFSMALVGVGYLVGIAACLSLLVGVVLSWGVLVPVLTHAVPSWNKPASEFGLGIWTERVRLVGAGIIGVGALWSAISLSKPMAAGIRSAFAASRRMRAGGEQLPRCERDIPIMWVVAASGMLALPVALLFAWFLWPHAPDLGTTLLAALAASAAIFVLVFGFFMATVCGYMAGLLGSSSSPISGIAILSTILVALPLDLILGAIASSTTGADSRLLKIGPGFALLITAVVVTISSIANDNLQDLKTGAMVNATPWRQQAVLLIGVLAGAIVIAPVLQLLYESYGFAGASSHAKLAADGALPAPQASLIAGITRGIFEHDLAWPMLYIGAGLGVVFVGIDALLKRRGLQLPVLTVGIGMYLPPTVGITIAIGGIVGWLSQLQATRKGNSCELLAYSRKRGVLVASGFLIGESLMGVVIVTAQASTGMNLNLQAAFGIGEAATVSASCLIFVASVAAFYVYLASNSRRSA